MRKSKFDIWQKKFKKLEKETKKKDYFKASKTFDELSWEAKEDKNFRDVFKLWKKKWRK